MSDDSNEEKPVESTNVDKSQNSDNEDPVFGYEESVYDEPNDIERTKTVHALADDIPNNFKGWGLIVTIGNALVNFNTWGANAGYALYLQNFLNESVFPGATKVQYGAIGGLTIAGIMLAPLINYMIGKLGVRVTMLIGVAIQFAGVFLASFSKKLWHLFLTEGLLQGIGMAVIVVPSVVVIPQWFRGGPGGKRNTAAGLCTAGSGFGGIVYNIAMQPIMDKHGWRWALRTQSIMCAVLLTAATFMLKSRSKNIKPIYKIYDAAVWKNAGLIMMILWCALTLLGYVTLMFNLGDFTRSMGYGSSQAAVVSAMISVGIIYGRPAVGIIGDKIGAVQVSIIADLLVCIFALAMWIPCKNYPTAVVMALFQGSLMGSIFVTMVPINASIIGLRRFGIGMSLSWIAIGVFGMISPIVGIELKGSKPHPYYHPAIFVGCCYFAAAMILVILRAWMLARKRILARLGPDVDLVEVSVPFSEVTKCFFQVGKI